MAAPITEKQHYAISLIQKGLQGQIEFIGKNKDDASKFIGHYTCVYEHLKSQLDLRHKKLQKIGHDVEKIKIKLDFYTYMQLKYVRKNGEKMTKDWLNQFYSILTPLEGVSTVNIKE